MFLRFFAWVFVAQKFAILSFDIALMVWAD